ncbi:MAG: septum site-determining protein MinC [Nostocaceae cyanobacterium]|nr:septum site-determining protein MinC [Nostocaceae cyanobacterium]
MTSDSALPDLEIANDVQEVIAEPQVNSESQVTNEPQATNEPEDLLSAEQKQAIESKIQVNLQNDSGRLLLILPAESQQPGAESWSDIWQQLKYRLKGGGRLWEANTIVHLIAQDRLLDARQLQEITEALTEAQLQLKSVATSRRQTAVAAAAAGFSVEQIPPVSPLNQTPAPPPKPLADTLYLQMTVRSGIEIRHPGTVVILGDLNPGGIVVADGDILVWGRLRGIAHAGAKGNRQCLILALQMEPTQLRIADAVARAPEKTPAQFYPEVAYVAPEGIRITRAVDFAKHQVGRKDVEPLLLLPPGKGESR